MSICTLMRFLYIETYIDMAMSTFNRCTHNYGYNEQAT